MSIWQAILYGLIQGLTEFIPISSTAHMTIAGNLLGQINPERPEEWTAFLAVTQLGTLVSLLVYFWRDIITITRDFFTALRATPRRRAVDEQTRLNALLGWMTLIGTVPIAVIGLLFKDVIEGSLTKNLWVIAGSLIGLAILLTVAEVVGHQNRDMQRLTLWDALAVGTAQALALIPGASRSGTTITAGLFCGLRRETAARFSFLLSIPAIGASGLLQLPRALQSVTTDWVAVAVATVVAGLSGYAAIAFLLRYLQRHTTYVFAGYRVAIGLLMIALLVWGKLKAY